jgi:hypothetical protein
LRAFPSWFLRIECDRCGKVVMVNEGHARWRDRTLDFILARLRHDGCGGRALKAELLSGVEGVQPPGAALPVAAGLTGAPGKAQDGLGAWGHPKAPPTGQTAL